jgi:NAD(P)-dependent dehydrogenase (short-subunit alcohol dehydrogenase family)
MIDKNEFSGKVVLVTGAGKGTGRAAAEAFAERGATVAVNDISPINVETLATWINAYGGHAKAYLHDIAKKVAAQALINEVIDSFERIDILVNCANVEPHGPLLSMDEWDLHRVFEVNTIGTFVMIQSVARVMRTQGGGVIVSVVKFPAEPTHGGQAAYAASRLAVAGLTQQAAIELGQHNVRIHAATNGLPQLHNSDETYPGLVEAVLALSGEKFAGQNGKIINVE